MKNVKVTFVPTPTLAAAGEIPKTYDFAPGIPFPEIGETVAFSNPMRSFKVVAKSFQYADEDTLTIFLSIDR